MRRRITVVIVGLVLILSAAGVPALGEGTSPQPPSAANPGPSGTVTAQESFS